MKNTKQNIIYDKRLSIIIYAVTLVIAVILRSLQLYNNVRFTDGRYIDVSILKNYTTICLFIGFALIALVMFFGKSNNVNHKSYVKLNPVLINYKRLNRKIAPQTSVFIFLTAFFIIYELIIGLSSAISLNKHLSDEGYAVSDFSGINPAQWIVYFFMIPAAVALVIIGLSIYKGEGVSKKGCLLLTSFAIFKLIDIFVMIKETQIIGIYSEKVYIMLTAMASAVFFMHFIRLFTGYEKKNTRIWMCIFGYAASIYAAVSVIPRYIMYFALDYSIREGMAQPDYSDIGIIFVTISIIAAFWSTKEYSVKPKINTENRRYKKLLGVIKKV